jgi:hypothetical protein
MWVISAVLILFGAYVSVLNWICIWRVLSGGPYASWTPLLGGLAGMIGFRLVPDGSLHQVSWVPLIVDFGCAPGLLTTVVLYAFFQVRWLWYNTTQ